MPPSEHQHAEQTGEKLVILSSGKRALVWVLPPEGEHANKFSVIKIAYDYCDDLIQYRWKKTNNPERNNIFSCTERWAVCYWISIDTAEKIKIDLPLHSRTETKNIYEKDLPAATAAQCHSRGRAGQAVSAKSLMLLHLEVFHYI